MPEGLPRKETEKEAIERIQSTEAHGNSYEKYRSLGGFLIETDFANALARAKANRTLDSHSLLQAQGMARAAGIVLEGKENGLDPRVALYDALNDILRVDPAGNINRYHYRKLEDKPLFAEALRMLGDTESLAKFLKTHSAISREGK